MRKAILTTISSLLVLAQESYFVQNIVGINGVGNEDNQGSTRAKINNSAEMALKSNGDIYFADSGNNKIRIFSSANSSVSTFAEIGSTPIGVVFDNLGNLFVSEQGTSNIRKIYSDGTVSTFFNSTSFSPATRLAAITTRKKHQT